MMSDARSTFSKAISSLFVALEPEVTRQLVENITLVHLQSGETLYRQGDPGTGMHILHTGRMQIRVASEEGAVDKVVGIMKPGEVVGEISLFTGGNRAATVTATRDSTLVYLAREDFDRVMVAYPALRSDVAHFIIDRLIKAQGRIEAPINPIRTIAVVPLDRNFDASAFTRRLQISLLRFGSTALVDSRMVRACFPKGLDSNSNEGVAELEHYLDTTEETNDYVLLEADPSASRWTLKCAAYADAIVFVAPVSTPIDVAAGLAQEVGRLRAESGPVRELVLVHGHRTALPQRTMSWLNAIPVERHHHVHCGKDEEFGRLARILSGNSVSLILGGGGARGFAHIGVIRSLREAGIPIDMVGGASQGAIVAAGVAMGWDDVKMLEEYRAAFVDEKPGSDYTLPVFSIIRGAKMSRGLQRHFGDTLIEDLRIPFFAVSSNLSRGKETVHRTGSLWRSLRASASLPAILPPMIENSELLVDGSILNNLPANVAKDSMGGYVIVVDISSNDDFKYNHKELPTVWEYLKKRIFSPRSLRGIPTIQNLVIKSTMLGSRREAEAARHLADLFISPPVKNFDMLGWHRMFDICEAGYAYSYEQVASWARSHPELIQHKEILDTTLLGTPQYVYSQ